MKTPDYLYRSQAMNLQARNALLCEVSSDWNEAKTAATQAAGLELASINKLRTAGLKLQEAAGGHECLKPSFFENVKSQLPADLTWKGAQFCASLSRQFDAPIKSLDEARAARKMLFEAFGQAEAPKRIAPQQAHEHNPFSDFVNVGASLDGLCRKLEAEPLEKWDKRRLRTFVSTLEPIVKRYQAAVELLKK